MNVLLATETAKKVYSYMKRGTAGLKQEKANEVDHDPASWGMDIDDWDWNAGVGMIAISDYYEKTEDPEVLYYIKNWVAKNKHQCAKKDHVNYLTPLAIYPDMYLRTKDSYYLDTAVDYANWVLQCAVRTNVGVFIHGAGAENEIWADTVFMALIFLARTAKLSEDKKMAEEVIAQLLYHFQFLQDTETGVLFHGFNSANKNYKSAARWTRGNSWLVLGAPIIIETLSNLVEIPQEIYTRYKTMVNGILKYQAENGIWHTVMDRPDFYQETSGSSGFAAGIMKSVRIGMLDACYIASVTKTMETIMTKINDEGAVEGVSGGTPIMPTIEAYGKLTSYPTLYGEGLTLMMFSEYLLQQKASKKK